MELHDRRVRIGGCWFTIQEEAQPRGANDGQLLGDIDYCNLVIRLMESQPPERKRETLVHELVHGIFETMGIEHKEKLVDRIAVGLNMVLLDNPWLLNLYRLDHETTDNWSATIQPIVDARNVQE